MSRVCAGLALLLLGGCLGGLPGRPGGLVEPLKPSRGPSGAETISLEVALLEQTVGDRYLNDGLWSEVDEQALDLDRKAVLADNGFRVGLVGGILPAQFLALLTAERSNPTPRQYLTQPADAKPVPLGSIRPLLTFQLQAEGKTASAEFSAAQCALQITPTPAPDGTVKLTFLPLVQHGAKAAWALPIDGGLPLHSQRLVERYPALTWDVTLTGSSYVVIGTRYDRLDTLGHGCFVSTEGTKPVQRLLVVRATRGAVEAPAPESAGTGRRTPAVAPLALQAAASARGTRE